MSRPRISNEAIRQVGCHGRQDGGDCAGKGWELVVGRVGAVQEVVIGSKCVWGKRIKGNVTFDHQGGLGTPTEGAWCHRRPGEVVQEAVVVLRGVLNYAVKMGVP